MNPLVSFLLRRSRRAIAPEDLARARAFTARAWAETAKSIQTSRAPDGETAEDGARR